MVKNHNILQEYLDLVNLYNTKYENSIVLLQVGSFYELYSTIENDPHLKQICELLNIVLTKKNKTIERISKSNPHMAGIPCCALEKYLDTLINNNYTVIVYNQYLDKKTIKRKLDRIYSIGTYIESEKNFINDNLILSIYIEYSKNKTNTLDNESFINGISIIDLATGSIKILEIYNTDYTKLIEDLNKELIIYNPKEIIFMYNKYLYESNYYNELMMFFKNKNCILHTNILDNNFANIIYQNEFFHSIFKNNLLQDTYLSPIEILDLEKLIYARISLIGLLKFAYNHDNMIINNLNKPIIINNSQYLNLHNNALYQLNILSYSNNYKYNSLFDIINKTSTLLGKRYLKYNLTYPLLDINELKNRYNLIEKISNKNSYLKYENELNNILDIEKYHKKLGVNKLAPYQYGKLNSSYKSIINLINLSKKHFNLFDYDIVDQFISYYNEYLHNFNISNLELYNYTNFQSNNYNNIFNDNIITELDELYILSNSYMNELNNIINKLSELINNEKIELKYTDRDGYFLSLTKNRANKLKKILDSNSNIDIELQDLQFTNKTQSNTYILSKKIKKISDSIIQNNNKIQLIMKEKYLEISLSLFLKYYKVLNYINYYISYIDLIVSFTKCSINNNYIKPIIIESDKSFIECKELRHPISEQLHQEYNYVTNDISLHQKKIGYLLYGSNGVGKSTLMKAVGLNIILAQIGCYVSASEFKYYPYSNLFTRIDHSDNLFKGLSSFESEILELKTILNYSDSNSLVLGDEILNSTENISAISIISSSINYFLENNISFIFASHLHQIPKYINSQLMNKLNISHLKMDYDPNTKTFIYNRKMFEGMPIKNYGLIVAKALLNNDFIINNSLIIQNSILNPNKIIDTDLHDNELNLKIKKSKYNKNILMSGCYICNDLHIENNDLNILETHHIVFQSNFENNKCNVTSKTHIKKNQESNLVNLCKYHHIEVHKNNIIINQWIKTSNGKKLDYIIN